MFRMPFSAFSTDAGLLLSTLYMRGCNASVMIPAKMPTDEMSIGYIMEHHPSFFRSAEDAASTSAAHVASAKEPKRSAPMPAMSPTLSPALSAMHPGLR